MNILNTALDVKPAIMELLMFSSTNKTFQACKKNTGDENVYLNIKQECC